MPREPESMRMIHEIRERQYEQRRDWTREQLLEDYRRKTVELAQEYGLEIAPLPEEQLKQRTG